MQRSSVCDVLSFTRAVLTALSRVVLMAVLGVMILPVTASAQDLEPQPTAFRLDDGSEPLITLSQRASASSCNGTVLTVWTATDGTSRFLGRLVVGGGLFTMPFIWTHAVVQPEALRVPPHVIAVGGAFRIVWAIGDEVHWRDMDATTLGYGPESTITVPPGTELVALDVSSTGQVALLFVDPLSGALSARAYEADGTPIAAAFPVGVATRSEFATARTVGLIWLDDGELLALWDENAELGVGLGVDWLIKTRRFDTLGMPSTGELAVFSGRREVDPLLQGFTNRGAMAVALPGGEVGIVHGRFGRAVLSGNDAGSVVWQKLDASHVASGEVEVQAPINFEQWKPQAIAEPGGDVLIVSSSDADGLTARRFRDSGAVVGTAVDLPAQVGTRLHGVGVLANVGVSAAVVWVEDVQPGAGTLHRLYYRPFTVPELHDDGFESDSTQQWCSTVGAAP